MRRVLSIAAGVTLALAATTVHAAAPQPKTIIEDAEADANFVNDQGTGDGSFGDLQPGASPGTVSDIHEVRLSNDAKNLYVDFVTQASPPATTGVGYRLRVNDGGCLKIEAFYPGANNVLTAAKGQVVDECEGAAPVEIEVIGQRLIVPRSASPSLAKGATLTAPQAQAFLYSGDYPNGAPTGTADTTKVGTDYKMVDKKKK